MVKEECKRIAKKMLSVGQIFEAYQNLAGTGDPKIVTDIFPANQYFINSLVEKDVITVDTGKFFIRKLADMTLLMHEDKPFSDISKVAREGKDMALQVALELFAECECPK